MPTSAAQRSGSTPGLAAQPQPDNAAFGGSCGEAPAVWVFQPLTLADPTSAWVASVETWMQVGCRPFVLPADQLSSLMGDLTIRAG